MTKPSALLRVVAATVLAVAALVGNAVPAHASVAILGGGSGFAALEIDQWRADTARAPFNLNVNYVSAGSTFGREQFKAGTFDYGATDIEYPPPERSALQAGRCAGKPLAQCFVYVPVSAGGLAFLYNLADSGGHKVNSLKLSRDVACKIFTGAITMWNDPAIVRYNPGLAAHARPIRAVVRADGAGESYVLSEFCIAVANPAWNAFINQQTHSGNSELDDEFKAGHPTSRWPGAEWGNVTPVPNADGVASYVADPTGGIDTIGYDAAGYAKVRGLPTASLQNAAGVFTQPDEDNVTTALHYATARGNGTFQLHFDGPDPAAYFPSTYSYVLAQTTGYDPAKGATLGQFLCFAVSKGQEIAVPLRYARLSDALVNIAEDAIVQIPGAPNKADCFVKGSAPPPHCAQCRGGGGGGGGGSGNGSGDGNGNSGGSGAVNRRAGPGTTAGNGTDSVRAVGKGGCASTTTTTKPNAAKSTSGRSTTTTTRRLKRSSTTTTSTTTPVRVACATSTGGDNGGGAAGPASADALLAQEAAAHQSTPSSSSGSIVWLILAGVLVAWAISAAMARRRGST